jgi:hypothetical protein
MIEKYLILILVIPIAISCTDKTPLINGISYVASQNTLVQEHVDPIIAINATHASIMPFGFIQDLDHPNINYNTERQWFGETRDGAKQYIDLLKQNNIQIMMKPQIWVWRGEFTGLIEMRTEEDWIKFEESYSRFILEFATLAEESHCELFCIGTELELFIENRPEFWKKLISEIRDVYSGKITYAANWDEYKRTPFWEMLDYIGVDAYFPISESRTPTFEETIDKWKHLKEQMRDISEKNKKKFLFTEYGYRSVDYAGKEPWKSDRNMSRVNLIAQSNLYKALYESVWNEDWFAGGFIWKWFIDDSKVGGYDNTMFTPQNKPVEKMISDYFLNHQ